MVLEKIRLSSNVILNLIFYISHRNTFGESKIMKKIIMLSAMTLAITSPLTFAACPISTLTGGACQADIAIGGINDKLQDKIVPNNLNNMVKPNSSFNNRSNLGQPNMPENINMEPIREEHTQPYNANCQFGNCLNSTNAGQNKNNK